MYVKEEKKTFGQNIELFKQYATIENNRDVIINHLERFNKMRNQVVHNLFVIEDMQKLESEIDEHFELADEIIMLLFEYDNRICEKFIYLAERVDFKDFEDIDLL